MQVLTAHRLGYGFDVESMNHDHDSLHAALCAWLGVQSWSLTEARGAQLAWPQKRLAIIEEDAVLAVQRLMRAHLVAVPPINDGHR